MDQRTPSTEAGPTKKMIRIVGEANSGEGYSRKWRNRIQIEFALPKGRISVSVNVATGAPVGQAFLPDSGGQECPTHLDSRDLCTQTQIAHT
jgi:hypothetical protein